MLHTTPQFIFPYNDLININLANNIIVIKTIYMIN